MQKYKSSKKADRRVHGCFFLSSPTSTATSRQNPNQLVRSGYTLTTRILFPSPFHHNAADAELIDRILEPAMTFLIYLTQFLSFERERMNHVSDNIGSRKRGKVFEEGECTFP